MDDIYLVRKIRKPKRNGSNQPVHFDMAVIPRTRPRRPVSPPALVQETIDLSPVRAEAFEETPVAQPSPPLELAPPAPEELINDVVRAAKPAKPGPLLRPQFQIPDINLLDHLSPEPWWRKIGQDHWQPLTAKLNRQFGKMVLFKIGEPDVLAASAAVSQIKALPPQSEAIKWPRHRNLWPASIFNFAVVCGVVILAIGALIFIQKGLEAKDAATGEAEEGYHHLARAEAAVQSADFEAAGEEFGQAADYFIRAEGRLNQLGLNFISGGALLSMPRQVASGKHLLSAGRYIAETGQSLALGLAPFTDGSALLGQILPADTKQPPADIDFGQMLSRAQANLQEASVKVDRVETEIGRVDINDLPPEIADQVVSFKEEIPALKKTLEQVVFAAGFIGDVLGQNEEKRYLILLANNREIRAGGGFIGSYAEIDLSPDQNKMLLQEVYATDGQFKEKIIPPEPLRFIIANWYMRDANWFAHYPDSARKVEWFYEHSGGRTLDGVISLTPTLIENLLRITGPIELPQYGVTVDADNFFLETEYQVEMAYDPKLNRPKQFIADLAPVLLARLGQLEPKDWLAALEVIIQGLQERQMVLYFNDIALENTVEERGWGGHVLQTPGDYLSIIDSNVGGRKTDNLVKQRIAHKATIQADGSIIDELRITRRHTGEDNWYSGPSFDYMRIYVPSGSELIAADGFEPHYFKPKDIPPDSVADPDVTLIEGPSKFDTDYQVDVMSESDKTVFGGWAKVELGETKTFTFKYRLPFKMNLEEKLVEADSYSLLVQKQIGDYNHYFQSELVLPEHYNITWSYPTNYKDKNDYFTYRTFLNQDKYYAVTVVPK